MSQVSRMRQESSLLSQIRNECRSTHENNTHGSEVRAVVDQPSDDSDSEIFRVKRRSSYKVEKRTVNDVSSKNFEHQVLFM